MKILQQLMFLVCVEEEILPEDDIVFNYSLCVICSLNLLNTHLADVGGSVPEIFHMQPISTVFFRILLCPYNSPAT